MPFAATLQINMASVWKCTRWEIRMERDPISIGSLPCDGWCCYGFLKPIFRVNPRTLVITYPSVLPHIPPFIIIILTIPLAPNALREHLCNWREVGKHEHHHSWSEFDKVNFSCLHVFVIFPTESPNQCKVPSLLLQCSVSKAVFTHSSI